MAYHNADLTEAVRAELAAAGMLVPEGHCFTVSARDILLESWLPGEVTYRVYGVPMTGELLDVIHRRRAQAYLETRTRTTINAFPWNQSRIGILDSIFKQTPAFKMVENRGRSSKFVRDHIGHGPLLCYLTQCYRSV